MSAGAVVVAGLLDATLREPPLRLHPVRLAGRDLDRVAASVPSQPPRRAMRSGGLAWGAGAIAALAAGAVLERAVRDAPAGQRDIVLGVALWPLLSGRLLLDEVAAVDRALAVDLDAGRAAVSRIVSRDVTTLSEPEVRQAAIESLSENLSDSVMAPLFWYVVGGLPGAALYRFVNTADAMWGYRNERWRHAGTVAARVDDLLNLVPARLTGVALAGRTSWQRLRRQAGRTWSPNAGWPMAGLALRLDIRLGKPDTYDLNPAGRQPTAGDTAAALQLVQRYIWASFAAAAVLAGWRGRRRAR
jgi:adenosylcobinamide-phosphate synthase